jgi:hypothetical protein
VSHRTLAVSVVFLAVFSMGFARETDIDFWWHLRTGQLIAETGHVPKIDPFSYTAAGRPWVAHEWLWELTAFHLYELGGYRLLVLLSALVVTAAYAVLYRLLRRLGTNEIFSALLVLWAVALAVPNFGVRPRELTHLFFGVFLSLLLGRRSATSRSLWLLPPTMLLWVNLHGAFVVGLAVLGIVFLGEVADWLRGRAAFPRLLALVSAATVVAACANPHGPAMLFYPFRYFVDAENPSFQIVTEFASPDFHDPMLLLLAAGLLCFMLLPPQRGFALVDALLIAAFTAQALVSARQVSLCAMILAPQLAERLRDRWAFTRERGSSRLPPFARAANVVLLLLLAVAGAISLTRPEVADRLQLGAAPDTSNVPVAGARFIEENALPDPIFHHQAWGGYLIHRWYPKRRVFIDGRIDMYGPEICEKYLAVSTVRPNWSAVLEEYGISTALVPKDSAISALLRGAGWTLVFRGELEAVYARRRPAEG